MRRIVITSIVALTMAAAPAFAKGKKASSKQVSDQTFVTKAASGGMAEVELGKMAQEKGTSQQVKDFGQRMVTDHSKANDELKSLAQSKNITLPTQMGPHEKATMAKLSKLSGAAFDRAYMQAMLIDHKTDVNEFRRESTAGKDSDVKSFAAKTLPTLEDHLKMAQDANRAVGTSGTKK